jgi:acetoin utilization protein AcuB
MIVRNWMKSNPIIIPSDTLASEAKRLLIDNNLAALPVVDNGRLRGLVTRANMVRMGHYVTRTQNPDELSFFVNRLRVRDIMVRNPATVRADDTMEHCLVYGQQLMVAQFPVMEEEQVVGIISANEIFRLAAHILGAWERRNGLTLPAVRLGPGVLGKIADVAEAAGAVLQAIYPVTQHDKKADDGYPEKTIILRFHAPEMEQVVSALEAAGFFPVSGKC